MGARKKAVGAAALSAVAMATLMGAEPAAAEGEIICTFDCEFDHVAPGQIDPFWKFTIAEARPGGTDQVFGKFVPAVQNAFIKVSLIFDKADEFNKVDDVFQKYDAYLFLK